MRLICISEKLLLGMGHSQNGPDLKLMMNIEAKQQNGPDEPSKPAAAPRRLDASALFDGDKELILVYRDLEYRLRLTSNDKLILTK